MHDLNPTLIQHHKKTNPTQNATPQKNKHNKKIKLRTISTPQKLNPTKIKPHNNSTQQ